MNRTEHDEPTMTLVESALAKPEYEREAFLREACAHDEQLFARAWSCLAWEKKMQRFLADPLRPPQDRVCFQPGQILIKRFRIVRVIARGGMGTVWEAIDEKLDRRVALKCGRNGLGNLLTPEVRHAREISHPNVCKLHELHTVATPDGEIDFISMEFVEGETLAARLKHVAIPENKARVLALQICAGLEEAHRNHLVHGDLKPNNILLGTFPDRSPRAVIMDFGLTQPFDSTTGALGGTPAYMAPELWRGQKPSVASDIYALGVLLWELHSGRLPSDLGAFSSTLPAGKPGQPIPWNPPRGGGKWNRVVARCLRPDPAERYSSVEEVASALGPSPVPKRLAAIAAVLLIALLSALLANWRAHAPSETVRLTVSSFSPQSDLWDGLLQQTMLDLAHVQGTQHTAFVFARGLRKRASDELTPSSNRITHTLAVKIQPSGPLFRLHAEVADLRAGVIRRQWNAEYRTAELRYVPAALTAFVTSTLHLRPPPDGAKTSGDAQADYDAGRRAARSEKTVNEALPHLYRAVKANSDSAQTWAALAEGHWFEYAATEDRHWVNDAAASLAQAEKRNQDVPVAHQIHGLLYKDEGRFDDAIREYLRSLEIQPADPDAFRRLGQAYQANGQLAEAKQALLQAVALAPNEYRNQRELGIFYYRRGDPERSIRYLSRAVELDPGNASAMMALGTAYLSAGNFQLAERELRHSLGVSETALGLQNLAATLMYERKYTEAVPLLLRCLQLRPNDYVAWYNLGYSRGQIKQHRDSVQAYRTALKLAQSELAHSPHDGRARAWVACLSALLGDSGRARSEIAQALSESGSDRETLRTIVLAYETLGLRDESLAVLTWAPKSVLADLNRSPETTGLQSESRFKELLVERAVREGTKWQ